MLNRRYFLVILDSSGHSVRRLSVSRTTLRLAALIVSCVMVVMAVLIVHGVLRRAAAHEAAMLAHENEELRATYAELSARLPEERLQALLSDLTFAQLWAKSGLGLEPRAFGVGPLESENLSDLGVEDKNSGWRWRHTHHVLSVEAASLPLELDRMHVDAMNLHSALGEMLEYFHDASLLLSNTPSVRPVNAGFQTSSFGKRRDPFHGGWVMHKGLDIGGRIGMEVFAPADGRVIFAGYRGGYGQTVVLDHGYGLQTHYAHLSRYRVSKGDRVERGDVIAEMGNSGRSTGPHLHYEVRRHGQVLNPVRFVLD